MLAWFNDIQCAQADTGKIVLFLDNIAKMGVTADAAEWLNFLKAKVWISEEANRQKGMDLLIGLTSTANSGAGQPTLLPACGRHALRSRPLSQAAKVWEEALAKHPRLRVPQ